MRNVRTKLALLMAAVMTHLQRGADRMPEQARTGRPGSGSHVRPGGKENAIPMKDLLVLL